MKRKSQSGIALVITLILLSVITFMAVTFLVVSRREGAQVDTLTSQTFAKEGAEAGMQQALGQIGATMQANQNGLNFGLLVSTNWNTAFYAGTTNLTDVCYYDVNGNLLGGANMEKMLNNLLILPRAPVFVVTNAAATPSTDFRYYNDLNRNGVYDTNGPVVEYNPPAALPVTNIYVGDPEWVGILNHPDARHSPSNFFIARYSFIALPIGNSLDINNIGNQAKWALSSPLSSMWQNGYLRNQGVGSWELNLAGFLHELNTNWDYTGSQYNYFATNSGAMNQSSQGTCFDDATEILQYRYGTTTGFGSLRSFQNLYAGNPFSVLDFASEFVDGYTHGPLMTTLLYNPAPVIPFTTTLAKAPWSGDYSTNQYFSTQDLFNSVPYYQNSSANALTSFSNHLYSIARFPNASPRSHTTANSYNRYTFYRMLSQMSFGSASEPAEYPYDSLSSPALSSNPNYASVYANTPRMNLNYVNLNGTNSTNFVLWAPVQFFTNAADRMLRAYFPNPIGTNLANGQPVYLSITNIPIYPTNYYTPAVHRILQLAANMYDASTNKTLSLAGFDYPSVFRPLIAEQTGRLTNIWITGYSEVSNNIDMNLPRDLRRLGDLNKIISSRFTPAAPGAVNIYGVPYVIGARQGFPEFNRFAMAPVVTISRKMEIVKDSPTSTTISAWVTNIQYTIGVSNVFGMDCWYAYTNAYYPRGIAFIVTNDFSGAFTNNLIGAVWPMNNNLIGATNWSVTNPLAYDWPGTYPAYTPNKVQNSFKVPLMSNYMVLPPAVLHLTGANTAVLNPVQNYTNLTIGFDEYNNGKGYLIPRWGVNLTNRIRVMMVDVATGRLIDYVQMSGGQLDMQMDINWELQTNTGQLVTQMWDTNRNANGMPNGILNQYNYSLTGPPQGSLWVSVPQQPGGSVQNAITAFNTFISKTGDGTTSHELPLVALTTFQKTINLAANDPLVHYTVGDITDPTVTAHSAVILNSTTNVLTGVLRKYDANRSQAWGDTQSGPYLTKIPGNEWAYKDPLVAYSDVWQFPTNKYPTVGWLGRVHRGTPWQTVYLKSAPVDLATWGSWTGDTNVVVSNNYLGLNYIITNGVIPNGVSLVSDATYSVPQNDYLLMDLFTTAPNANASMGQLSINQTGTAAWAAALDGLVVITNTSLANGTFTNQPRLIDPANVVGGNGVFGGTNIIPYLVKAIVDNRTNYPGQTYNSLGQICSVPQLTLASPFLNYPTNSAGAIQSTGPNQGIGDAEYEWIPQQIMSLLRLGTPRYVIFAYGQSLKPAPHSIVTSGPYFGMCTNYQVTGEVATRTVVRFDNFPTPGHPASPKAVVESFNVLSPTQ